jgi:hypothetical protein
VGSGGVGRGGVLGCGLDSFEFSASGEWWCRERWCPWLWVRFF